MRLLNDHVIHFLSPSRYPKPSQILAAIAAPLNSSVNHDAAADHPFHVTNLHKNLPVPLSNLNPPYMSDHTLATL